MGIESMQVSANSKRFRGFSQSLGHKSALYSGLLQIYSGKIVFECIWNLYNCQQFTESFETCMDNVRIVIIIIMGVVESKQVAANSKLLQTATV